MKTMIDEKGGANYADITIAHIVQVNWTMTMMKFVHALNVVVACTGTEKFGNAQIATIQKKIKN